MLTVRDIASRLQVSPSCVYQLIESGRLSHHRIGTGRGAIRVSESDLQDYLDSCQVRESSSKSAHRTRRKPRVALKHLKLG